MAQEPKTTSNEEKPLDEYAARRKMYIASLNELRTQVTSNSYPSNSITTSTVARLAKEVSVISYFLVNELEKERKLLADENIKLKKEKAMLMEMFLG